MNIVIYTSSVKGAFNDYNIYRLLKDRPEHNYAFVEVKREVSVSLWLKFKRFVVTLRDGKDLWERDLRRLDNVIRKKIDAGLPENCKTHFVDSVNGPESEALLKELKPDIILQAGAGILKKNIFSIAKRATINVHHGFAPEIRGVASTFWCLYYGLTDLIGVTCHEIDETLDTGAVITQFKYPYSTGDSFLKIQETLCLKGADILLEAVDLYDQNAEFTYKSEEKKSYYFSNVHYVQYNLLKKNGFLPLKASEVGSLKTKMKPKTLIRVNHE